MSKAARLVILPAPGVGHLMPAIEFAKRLADHFSITILLMRPPIAELAASAAASVASATSLPPTIQFVELPLVDFSVDKSANGFVIIQSLFIEAHKTVVKNALADLPPHPPTVAMFIDFFATTVTDVTAELGIPCYVYFTSSATNLGVLLYEPTLDVTYPSEMEELAARGETLDIPTLSSPLPPLVRPGAVMSKNSEGHKWHLHHARRLREVDGFVVNTFAELEPVAIRALSEGRCLPTGHRTPPVYPVGPVISIREELQDKYQCIEWLDRHPSGTVVFLCFGSMGCFGAEQVREIAAGLERSGHRFLWCLRGPPKERYGPLTDADLDAVLPDGFLGRTRERGMVWPRSAPQREILEHEAVGGFVSHCGWNSCLESVWAGVPMLGWPLYAEQQLNAFQMAREVGVAVEMDVQRGSGGAPGVVAAEEVERGVRCLMGEGEEGRRARERAKEVKEMSRRAVAEGGSARVGLEHLIKELTKGLELAQSCQK